MHTIAKRMKQMSRCIEAGIKPPPFVPNLVSTDQDENVLPVSEQQQRRISREAFLT